MKNIMKCLVAMVLLMGLSTCVGSAQSNYSSVDASQFAQDLQNDTNAYVLDARTPQEYASGHIRGAHNLDWLNQQQFRTQYTEIPVGATVYVYCRSGKRSAEAAQFLADEGYKVVDLKGGYMAWERAFPQ